MGQAEARTIAPARGAAIRAEPARSLGARIGRGELKAAEVAEAFLARIAEAEPEVHAFAWHDPTFVRHQAAELDRYRASGRPVGRLHGVPVALKDIIDTARIPTTNGTPLDAGRVPDKDAWIVARLKAEGALILGKTVTTELAYLHPGPTANPAAPGHTPGGSSSGSAAAVAAGMAPLAIGTQTGGSVIRPASFCGVAGFKPSFGAIPRTGILRQSGTLDTVGVFARDAEDCALLADALFGHDPADPATTPAPAPRLYEAACSPPPVTPTLAFVEMPGWASAHEDTRGAFAELVALLGEQCWETPLPRIYDEAAALRERINFAEMAHAYHRYDRADADLSPEIRAALDAGRAVTAKDYLAALDWQRVLRAGIEEILERADAILCPAAPGPAPEGLGSTGSAIFNGLWTWLGLPAITLPLLQSQAGLPIGVQLVGRPGDDARLLRTAAWLDTTLAQPEAETP
ncbi:MAG: amidase [Rhodobacteraceae bacterium]|jgi:Asp-tRNA(Asn)/Glu-tRNA(Gln) amidotransferase A subunit family amidase|nr:amidase [Paracoccaceae bacterium]